VRDAFTKKTVLGGKVNYLTKTDLTMLKLFQMKKAINPSEVTDAMASMWKYEQLFKKMPRETRRGLGKFLKEAEPGDLVPQ
ncbi:MAG: hypothetical protein GTO54_07410, partial [Nitrososphaeria archaeon]|nr:hypothetical protein [Nitrososphaeria archaeon]